MAGLVNNEVRSQLPKEISDNALRTKAERARKVYALFDAIGEDKIVRIRSFTPSTILKLCHENIDRVIIILRTH